ncbi:uncharacterized protein [Linepithema humile]|uniref:uncharacterized protein n=1 Tax=Linepithema humile TaxID=83485 RepID=UPI00351EDF7A
MFRLIPSTEVEDQKEHDEAFNNSESSVSIDTANFSLESSSSFFHKKRKRNVESTDITSEIIDNIVQVQEEIRVKLDHLKVKLDHIIKKLFPEEVKLTRPHGIPAFPLRTEKEWENLEEILADDNAFTYVVDVFAAKIKN